MSYDRAALAARVKEDMETNPRLTLRSICLRHQVDRHTVSRALKDQFGLGFAELKGRVGDERIRAALSEQRAAHIKQAALSAGYSSGAALAKRTRKAFGSSPSAIRRRGGT